MAKRWTIKEEFSKKNELSLLYVRRNKPIGEIARILDIGESTVYDRLLRLKIPVNRKNKEGYNNIRNDICIPKKFSENLAEFVGILLGDGHLRSSQVSVTLGKKDEYANHVMDLMDGLFHARPKKIFTKR